MTLLGKIVLGTLGFLGLYGATYLVVTGIRDLHTIWTVRQRRNKGGRP